MLQWLYMFCKYVVRYLSSHTHIPCVFINGTQTQVYIERIELLNLAHKLDITLNY